MTPHPVSDSASVSSRVDQDARHEAVNECIGAMFATYIDTYIEWSDLGGEADDAPDDPFGLSAWAGALGAGGLRALKANISRQHVDGFTPIPHSWTRDRRLSFEAFGILTRLLSYPRGTGPTAREVALERGGGETKKSVRQLEKCGYLEHGRVRAFTAEDFA